MNYRNFIVAVAIYKLNIKWLTGLTYMQPTISNFESTLETMLNIKHD